MIFATVELQSTAVFLLVVGVLVAMSVMFSRQMDRLGVPIVLLFLILGVLGGSEGVGGIAFDDFGFAVRVGTIYLVLILFDGGMTTPWRAVRGVLLPAGILATFGVALTAGLLALFGWAMGLAWREAFLLGAVVSSTDAAAVLAVLRGGGLKLHSRVGRTLEAESCMNDPMALILTTQMIELAQSPEALRWTAVLAIPLQLAVGTAVGLAIGYLGVRLLHRVRPATVGLYPGLTLAIGFVSFGVATVLRGSGLLSVYLTALVLGNSRLPYHSGLLRVHESLAWLSQIALFLMLGLLVFPSRLISVAGMGLAAALFLAVVARPLAVTVCLLPFRWPLREVLYTGWIGLRGAVPIILGALPMLEGVPGAERVFNMVFFIVVTSTLLPGATIRSVTRRLKLAVPEKPKPSAVLEINAAQPLNGEIVSFLIEPEAAVCGARLSEVRLPADSAVMLIVRGNDLVAPRGHTVLMPGDHAYLFFRAQDRAYIELLFGREETG